MSAATITLQVLPLDHFEGLSLPKYETTGSAGMDVRAANPADEPIILEPGARARCDGQALVVTTTDRRFGEVRLDLAGDSRSWASRIGALG